MDGSWRIQIGPLVPLRGSPESQARRRPAPGTEALDPDDFHDVFGGPPLTILQRRFSGNARTATFYDPIFRPAEESSQRAAVGGSGRSSPGFSIPRGGALRREEGFYDDIFGSGDRRWDGQWSSRSRSMSKSNSSTILSSEGLSPLRPSIAKDAGPPSFTSKLRPTTTPSRRPDSSLPSTVPGGEQSNHSTHAFPCSPRPCFMDFHDSSSNNKNISSSGSNLLLRQRSLIEFPRFFSPPKGHGSSDEPIAGFPLSMVPSASERAEQELEKVVMEVEEGRAKGSAFVLGIDVHGGIEAERAAAVDEAIAWAKDKSCNPNPMSKGYDNVGDETKKSKERGRGDK